MNRPDFIAHIRNFYHEGVLLIEVKNAGYGQEENPFSNFEKSKVIGVDVHTAILVRLMDKFSRIHTLLENPNANKIQESLHDTLLDAANYFAILDAWLKSKEEGVVMPPHPIDESSDGKEIV